MIHNEIASGVQTATIKTPIQTTHVWDSSAVFKPRRDEASEELHLASLPVFSETEHDDKDGIQK